MQKLKPKVKSQNCRRKTRTVSVGNLKIGGGHPVSIQSMTKVKTSNIEAAVKQIKRLQDAGCEIIRVAVKDFDDAAAIREIKRRICIPLVADIHFDYRLALEAVKNGADKIRLNPGNIKNPARIKEIIKAAKRKKLPIRIGVNSGSIHGGRASVNAALKHIKMFERENFRDIIISLKSSSVSDTVKAYRTLAKKCNYPFHLGVTAAGSYDTGVIKSSIGIGALLLDGIGDTIRVSLTGDPVAEVVAAKRILQALGLRNFGPDIISCPTCGRCRVDLVNIVNKLDNEIRDRAKRSGAVQSLPDRGSPKGTRYEIRERPFTIAIMGCEVNGPGEAREADIGIAFGKGSGILFSKGKVVKKVTAKSAVSELLKHIK